MDPGLRQDDETRIPAFAGMTKLVVQSHAATITVIPAQAGSRPARGCATNTL